MPCLCLCGSIAFRVRGHLILSSPSRFDARPFLRAKEQNRGGSGNLRENEKYTEKLERRPRCLRIFTFSYKGKYSRENDHALI